MAGSMTLFDRFSVGQLGAAGMPMMGAAAAVGQAAAGTVGLGMGAGAPLLAGMVMPSRGVQRQRGADESQGLGRNDWNSDEEEIDEFGRRKRARPRGRPGGGAEAAAKQAAECRALNITHESMQVMEQQPPPMDQQLRRIREIRCRPLPEQQRREEPDEASMSWLGALQKAHSSDGPPPPPLDEQMRRLQEREDKLKYKKLADFSDEAAYIQYVRQHLQIGMTVIATSGDLKGDTGMLVEDPCSDSPKFKWEKYRGADGNSESSEHIRNVELVRMQAQPTPLCDMGCGLPAAPGTASCCRGCAMAGAHDEQCQRRAMMATSAAQQAAQTSFSVEVPRQDWEQTEVVLQKLVTAALAAGWTSPLDLISRGNLIMIDAKGRQYTGMKDRPKEVTNSMFPVIIMYKLTEAAAAASAAASAAAAGESPPAPAGSVVPARPGYQQLESGRLIARDAHTGTVIPPRKFQRQEVKPDPALPVFCKFFAAGKCTKGSACTFTHTVQEGHCMSGQACIYAHGADELDTVMKFQAMRQGLAPT